MNVAGDRGPDWTPQRRLPHAPRPGEQLVEDNSTPQRPDVDTRFFNGLPTKPKTWSAEQVGGDRRTGRPWRGWWFAGGTATGFLVATIGESVYQLNHCVHVAGGVFCR